MAARRLPAALLLASATMVAPAEARQATEPAPPPAAQPAPTLPSAPIPYNQLRRQRTAPAVVMEEEKEPEKPAEPMKRVRSDTAILQALDKVTAETLRFEARVGQPVRYKTLTFTVRACETTAPDELAPDSIAYVVIDSQPRPQGGRTLPARQVFRGWIYASSPGVNALEHPVYDAWVISCKTAAPSPVKR